MAGSDNPIERMTIKVRPRVMDTYKLIKSGNLIRARILEYLQSEYKVCYSTAESYYIKANRLFKTELKEEIEAARKIQLEGLLEDADKAYAEYEEAVDPKDKVAWFKIYQDSKIKGDKYYKDDLRAEDTKSDSTINVTFSEAEKKDD